MEKKPVILQYAHMIYAHMMYAHTPIRPYDVRPYKVCVITIIVSYVGGEQSRTSMKATSLPSSTVD